MIEIIGPKHGSEYQAALDIKNSLEELWPKIARAPKNIDHVVISANVKISGYQVSDIDVVIAGKLSGEYAFRPNKVIKDKSGREHFNELVCVKNFVLAIEVKDHGERSVQQVGDGLEVYYSSGAKTGWSSATDQNIKQVHALKHFLSDCSIQQVYIHRCVIMTGLSYLDVPGALPGNFDGVDLFSSIAALSRVDFSSGSLALNSCSEEHANNILKTSIFNTLIPTKLDRRRMDLIASESKEVAKIIGLIGKKTVILRGHAGSGKTIMLLQAANQLTVKRGMRTLFLTYNHALAADVRRLLSLLGVPSSPYEGGIVVRTVMSFMCSCFRYFGLLKNDESLEFENYLKLCRDFLDLVKAGALTEKDIRDTIAANPDSLAFNTVMVDEGQDWPDDEAMLLKIFFGFHNLCIADGVDQLIRGSKRTGWTHLGDDANQETVCLELCLRMKRNLADFVSEIARANNTVWGLKLNNQAGGGRVLIMTESYAAYAKKHLVLVRQAKEDGNAEIDFLFCVPQNSVTLKNGIKTSNISEFLVEQDSRCWNGVDDDQRKDFPRSKDEFRIVQYQSCRGLEGWIVILEHLDEFWKLRYEYRKNQGLSKDEESNFLDINEISENYAWSQTIMAMSRPIDTLIITLKDKSSNFSKIVQEIANRKKDYIDVFSPEK